MIKIAEVQIIKGEKYVTGLICKPTSSDDPDLIAEDIAQIFRSLKAPWQKIYLNIPRYLATTRFLKIPSVDDEEIVKIIKIESVKHLPYTDEEVVYGYRIIEKMEDGYSNVLLAIAQAGVVNGFIDILKKAGINNIRSLSLGSEGLFLWYMSAAKAEPKENVMVVNLDSDHIDIDIVEKDKLVFTRGIAYGPEDPKKINKIASEINVSISTYHKDTSMTVSRIILTGPNSETEHYAAMLSREVNTPLEIINQTANMPLGEAVESPAGLKTSFAELLGVSLQSDSIKINLIPEGAREDTRIIVSKNNLITALILSAILIIMVFGISVKKLHDKSVYFAVMNKELVKIGPRVTDAKKMLKDINVIREAMARKPLAIDIISEICGITPGNISLNALDYESGKSLSVRGTASALGDVFKYVTILENSPYFDGAKVRYANKRTFENREVAEFEINAFITRLK